MLLGVVSDTHGHAPFTREAVRMLASLEAERLIHCGDIGSAEIAELLRPWPVDYVLGNVDGSGGELAPAIAVAGGTLHGQFASLELAGRRIALLHGHDSRRLRESIAGGEYDLVCHGHTHERRLEQVGTTLVLNPGAVFRANPRSIALVRLPELEVTHVSL
ncbi:MAG: YfcE family phosphodiesterase [Pirellulales bacterium]|nr:YfcE family phosphodiesterase [Pirellulales bacterium]